MGRAIGIDFGTSFSCMAILHGMEAEVIPNVEGDRLTPSVVAIGKDGQLLVGEPARRQSIINPDNTIFSIKRLLSRRFGELDNRLLPFKITKAANGNAMVVMGSRHYRPPEISAMILRKLHSDAEAYLGEIVSGAVITVPAYFNDIQRRAIEEACKIAEFEVYRIINEPTAAALTYGLDIKRDVTIAVYHLGGGTFDISILEIGEGSFQVMSTNGDTHLGGDDFDHRIVDWLCDEFNREHGIDLSKDKTALQRLREAAERAKCDMVKPEDLEGLDALIVGSPIHAWGPTAKIKSFLKGLKPDGLSGVKAAAFDTGYKSRFAGSAAKKIEKMLKKAGCSITVPGEKFVVTGNEGPLAEGELDKAAAWAKDII